MNSTDPDYDDAGVDSHGIYAEPEEDAYEPDQDERFGHRDEQAS